jgi:DNA-binding response OmpR family regulator
MTPPEAPFPRRRAGAIITPMKRALVVDDQDGYRLMFCRFLGLHGFKPLEAADGESGLALARAEKPDLIFMDWCLPGQSGLEIVRCLRGEPDTAPIPVVMMSSLKESPEDEARAMRAGADFFLDKRELDMGDMKDVNAFLRHVRALLLRGAARSTRSLDDGRIYEADDLRLDVANVELTVAGRRVHLQPKELILLEVLLRWPGVVHSAQDLWRLAWGTSHRSGWEHILAAAIHELRQALGPAWGARIENVRARGYRLPLPDQPAA